MFIKQTLRSLAITVFLILGVAQAHAACEKEREAMLAAADALVKNGGERLLACGNQRICMGQGRINKAQCKQTAKEEKFACLSECRELSGRDKRQCKQECRAGKRIAKMTCRNLSEGDKAECREDNPQCVQLRNEAVSLTITGVAASAAYYSCLRENNKEGETEEEREAAEDAEEASQS